MVAFLYAMPTGFPGTVNRIESATIVGAIINTSTPPTRYGDAVAQATDGTIRPITTGDDAFDVVGALVRPYPTQSQNTWPNSVMNTSTPGTPPTSGPADMLTRGFMSVKVNGAAAAAVGGQVYIRVASGTADQPIGGYEAAADGGNTIFFPGAFFRGAQDSNGIAEISVFVGPQAGKTS